MFVDMADNDKKWETLKSEYLIKRPWLTARRDVVKLPTGAVNNEYYVLEYPDWVNIIAIRSDGKFVLVRQYRYGIGETSVELCAGVCEQGENPEQSARRELSEETGYAGGEWKEIMTLSPNASTSNNFVHCFIATGVEQLSGQHLDRTEDIDILLFTRAEVLSMLENNQIKQATMAAPLWYYFAHNK